MKLRSLSLILLIGILTACSSAPNEAPTATISVQNNAIVMLGSPSAEIVDELVRIAQDNPTIKTFRVSSEGGDPMAAMEWGYYMYRNRFTIEVVDRCLDSCANYFFTAAHERKLYSNAIVAWSGGAQDESWINQWSFYIFPGFRNVVEHYLDAFLRRETRFFNRINVDQDITHFGFDEQVGCMDGDTFRGFYYDVADLLILGVGRTSRDTASWDSTFAHYPDNFCQVELDPVEMLE